jgi:hypothetical protein
MIRETFSKLPVRKRRPPMSFVEEQYKHLNQVINEALTIHERNCPSQYHCVHYIYQMKEPHEFYFRIDVESDAYDDEFSILATKASLTEIFGLESPPVFMQTAVASTLRFTLYAPITTKKGLRMLNSLRNKLKAGKHD